MQVSNITLVKTFNGNSFIGYDKTIDPNGNFVELDDCYEIRAGMTPRGMAIMFVPLCEFASKEIKQLSVRKDIIMCQISENEIEPEILSGYKSKVSGIALPKGGFQM